MEAAITVSVLDEQLARIRRAFRQFGFVQAGELADRHGALQLTYSKESGGLTRLILFNEAVGTGEDNYRGSIDIVVQAGERFVRRRVTSSRLRVAFEREITGGAVEAAVALAESLTDKDLTKSFALRQEQEIASAAEQEKNVATPWRNVVEALHPDELTELLKRTHEYAKVVLRRHGLRASRYAFTSEEFVDEAITLALRGNRVYPDGLGPYTFLAGIVRSLIDRESDRFERQHVSIVEEDSESHGIRELRSPEDLEAEMVAHDLREQFVRTLEPDLKVYVELCIEESGSTAEELARRLGTTVQHIRNLHRKLARRRAQWNSR
jgi:hypothetical protein